MTIIIYCKLTQLNLFVTGIADQGVLTHLCDALRYVNNCKLTKLNLIDDDNITDQGVSRLCNAAILNSLN